MTKTSSKSIRQVKKNGEGQTMRGTKSRLIIFILVFIGTFGQTSVKAYQESSKATLPSQVNLNSLYFELAQDTIYPARDGFRDRLTIRYGIQDSKNSQLPVFLTYGYIEILKSGIVVKRWNIDAKPPTTISAVSWNGKIKGKIVKGRYSARLVAATKQTGKLVKTSSFAVSKKMIYTSEYSQVVYGRNAFDRYYTGTVSGCSFYYSKFRFYAPYDSHTCVGIQNFTETIKNAIPFGVDVTVRINVSNKFGCVNFYAPYTERDTITDCSQGTGVYDLVFQMGSIDIAAPNLTYALIAQDSSFYINRVTITYFYKELR